jgi:dTDP-glucose 4,6-dehydratase
MKANMDLKNKNVLVTGAGGFIGSQLVEALLEQGASVRAFVRYNSRADNGLARSMPGWKPEVSFEDGLEHTINRVSSNMDLYRTGTYEV